VGEDDRFIEEWRPFVANIAHRIRAQIDYRGDLDDLIMAGFKGLLEAKSRFDAARGVQFNTFAFYRVRGAMFDHIRELAYLPRRMHQIRKAHEAVDLILEDKADTLAQAPDKPTVEDAVESIDSTLARMTASWVLSSLGQDEAEPRPTPEDEVDEARLSTRVRRALDVLPERERALVLGFYFEGRQFDEVAKELGISKSWASRLHTKALTLLKDALSDLE
jgi:RNA polymerase sigma factor for flagellar operon FliA